MCEALRQLMKPEIDEILNEALNNQKLKEAKQLLNHVENAAKNFEITIEAACKALEISMEDYQNTKNFIDGISDK